MCLPIISSSLPLGWIAVFGAVVLLILSDIDDLESILHKIEWGTLLFFAGLFILMEGLGELGLIRFIGDLMVQIVKVSDTCMIKDLAVTIVVVVVVVIGCCYCRMFLKSTRCSWPLS